MSYLTVPPAVRQLSDTLAAEAAVIRRACGSWTTPEALASAERAADRMRAQIAAVKAEINKVRGVVV
ncbi:MAG: hypothetical protein IM650_02470 [Phenylobacterium sp.]|uniref:hypothetical protein n=1 Tax=Phenylobacterium sp. TaxID=1871053 RepID=UPI0025F96476|nr:hypothetical protein [Phenylobacterium sp.]MCA6256947.1 hypothetical protein [Phenylobacterium sp.]MCA6264127.1 hypothetical protein [Phenylobacterium sp.]MCA6270603.1 hypothetical protein [Phenylobacterium sp.]MCA6281391.1 hypothetical protein [Phenylobacterium sp.]MCA6301202.1 hypothetical protein [Phenylobacterium sp.]